MEEKKCLVYNIVYKEMATKDLLSFWPLNFELSAFFF